MNWQLKRWTGASRDVVLMAFDFLTVKATPVDESVKTEEVQQGFSDGLAWRRTQIGGFESLGIYVLINGAVGSDEILKIQASLERLLSLFIPIIGLTETSTGTSSNTIHM